jgi:transposase
MSNPLLPDGLWNLIQPMLPPVPSRPKGGRPRLRDRACFTGIIFVLRSGIPWEMLPQEMGCGSGMTCWRRLRDWQERGIWDLIHFVLLDWLARCGRIDWSRAVMDSSSVRAVFGGRRPVLILLTELSWAASGIYSATGAEFRSSSSLLVRTEMIRSRLWLWLTRFRRCRESTALRVVVPPACWVTVAMTHTPSG